MASEIRFEPGKERWCDTNGKKMVECGKGALRANMSTNKHRHVTTATSPFEAVLVERIKSKVKTFQNDYFMKNNHNFKQSLLFQTS